MVGGGDDVCYALGRPPSADEALRSQRMVHPDILVMMMPVVGSPGEGELSVKNCSHEAVLSVPAL